MVTLTNAQAKQIADLLEHAGYEYMNDDQLEERSADYFNYATTPTERANQKENNWPWRT